MLSFPKIEMASSRKVGLFWDYESLPAPDDVDMGRFLESIKCCESVYIDVSSFDVCQVFGNKASTPESSFTPLEKNFKVSSSTFFKNKFRILFLFFSFSFMMCRMPANTYRISWHLKS